MYSPKIAERLIPPLYRLARARGQHMTTIVNEVLTAYLAGHRAEAPAPHAGTVRNDTAGRYQARGARRVA